ncbi:MAG: nucleotidyl transferase AbiEii/AbiGii toxin family protein [Pseudomonadota bacterium]
MQNIEQSIKAKLKNISSRTNIPINTLLNTFFLERILVRISKSRYHKNIIFKGGLCLTRMIKLDRETKDIDLLITELKNNIPNIKDIFEDISRIKLKDGCTFSSINVSEMIFDHKKYPRYRVSIIANCGQIKNKLQIDIGFGDIVKPNSFEIALLQDKEPIFEKSVKMLSYPPEYIFSEKLEAIIFLAEANSRMKDFYDLYLLIESDILNKNLLKKAIKDTFTARNTKFSKIPTEKDFINSLEPRWHPFLTKNNKSDKFPKFEDIIHSINSYLDILDMA